MPTFISVDEALREILFSISRLSAERIHLGQAVGRVLAESIPSPNDYPRFDNSAMDGVALRFDDLDAFPATLTLAAESAAGRPAEKALKQGEAFRISTGAQLPAGADTVVPREFLTFTDHKVTIDPALPSAQNMRPPSRGANIRRAGSYLKAGETALPQGLRLGGAEIGLLASFGISQVTVHRRPRAAIISTGDELVDIDAAPGPGQIINSNAYMLEALIKKAGAIPLRYPIAPDNREAIAAVFQSAIQDADIVISSGGVSVGDHDHVKDVLTEAAGGINFWKVKVKPGKPLAFGLAEVSGRPVPLIGLPGNPASSFVGFHLFVAPALALAAGLPKDLAALPRIEATLQAPARGARFRRAYLAGRVEANEKGLHFTPLSDQSSGNPALFAAANAIGIVEEDQGSLDRGDKIQVHLL